MSKTLILLFHPQFGQSRANRALCNAASTLPGVEIADLYALYPDGAIDVDAEVRRLLGAERIVFQFPLQWYATPALLKTWQDAVLTRMFYIAYETEGRALEGKPMLVAATAGNVQQAYGPGASIYLRWPSCCAPCRPPPTAADCHGPRPSCSMRRASWMTKRWLPRANATLCACSTSQPSQPGQDRSRFGLAESPESRNCR